MSGRNIKMDRWQLDDVKFISREDYEIFSRRVKPRQGDVLYTKGGTTGVARVVDLDFDFQVWVHVAVLKCRTDLVVPAYLSLALNSGRCYEQAQLETRGATNQDLGLSRMKRIELPLPASVDEQRALVEYVAKESLAIDAAMDRAKREVQLLGEFRIRLTSDAVTGQVDLREVASTLPDFVEHAAVDADSGEDESFDELDEVLEEADA